MCTCKECNFIHHLCDHSIEYDILKVWQSFNIACITLVTFELPSTYTHTHTHTLDIEKYYSVDDYEAEEDDEISFPKGVVVDVIQKRLDGWWFVKHEDKSGLAPATFLRKGLPPAKPELVSSYKSQNVKLIGLNYTLSFS